MFLVNLQKGLAYLTTLPKPGVFSKLTVFILNTFFIDNIYSDHVIYDNV
jgi:hypothetical protein